MGECQVEVLRVEGTTHHDEVPAHTLSVLLAQRAQLLPQRAVDAARVDALGDLRVTRARLPIPTVRPAIIGAVAVTPVEGPFPASTVSTAAVAVTAVKGAPTIPRVAVTPVAVTPVKGTPTIPTIAFPASVSSVAPTTVTGPLPVARAVRPVTTVTGTAV